MNALENKQVIIQNFGMYQTKSIAISALAPFVGSSIFVPGIGQVIVGAAGLIVGGVVIFKAGSWAWNTAKNFFADENNWTADQIISKKRKGSIRREFPGEYLGKTLKEINKDAKQGNARAKKAKKLLQDGRFQK